MKKLTTFPRLQQQQKYIKCERKQKKKKLLPLKFHE